MILNTHRIPNMILQDHVFHVPLDHHDPAEESLQLFAREVIGTDPGQASLPLLLFLQGGPGHESPRPPTNSDWLDFALQHYRVLLLDQRGTGRSSRLDADTLARFRPDEQARRLGLHRLDSIVQDCELIRQELLGDEPWTVLGQSYGGFCSANYLSVAPEGLRQVFITGGIPPIGTPTDDIYRNTYQNCRDQNDLFYERYPIDIDRSKAIVRHLETTNIDMPDGGHLSPERFQQLGMLLGFTGGHETLHYLIEDAFETINGRNEISYNFMHSFDRVLHFSTNPLFTILHEPIYCEGMASDWSAARVLQEFPDFRSGSDIERVLFTGEMVFPWMFEQVARLRPLEEAAHILADRSGWPSLYDRDQFEQDQIPVHAAVYQEDMYVDRRLSLQAAKVIAGIDIWLSEDLNHDALRAASDVVLPTLHARASA